jgi:predicted DNA-binding transcriptional regulator AlpA
MNLLTAKQVAEKLSCHISFVWTLSKEDPSFPPPLQIGKGTVRARGTRWVDSALDNWLLTKQQGADTAKELQHEHGRIGADVHQDSGEEVSA